MNINTKTLMFVVAGVVVTSAAVATMSSWQISRTGLQMISQIERLGTENTNRMEADGKRELQAFRDELMARRKEYLSSQVQTVMGVLEKSYRDSRDPEKLREVFREPLQNAVNTAFSILEAIDKTPGLSLQEKQQKASDMIKALRYGPDNQDYFWINDLHPTMIMHPYKPELNGKDLSDSKDPNGKALFVEFAKTCKENGEGFVDYHWPKYGSDKPVPKLSFVKLFKPWNWVIGSGIYMEVAETKLKANAAKMIEALRYGADNKDYFWINDLHPTMVMHPYKPELNGKDLSDQKDPNGKALFVEFARVSREKGEGFVDYQWPKYGADKPVGKLSFVKLFKEWNWVIGTGLYIDDIDTMAQSKEGALKQQINSMTTAFATEVGTTKQQVAGNTQEHHRHDCNRQRDYRDAGSSCIHRVPAA